MPDFAGALGASKAASALLVLFIPSKDRRKKPIEQRYWVKETLNVLGTLFGGATAFPRGQGIWRDDAQDGRLLIDDPVVVQCYTSEHLIEEKIPVLRDFLHRMGREARQGAIGLVIDDDYLENRLSTGKSPGTSATKWQEKEVSEDGKKHRQNCIRSRRKGRGQGASYRRRSVRCCTAGPYRCNHTSPP